MQYPGRGDGRDGNISLVGNVTDTSILSTFSGTGGSTNCTLQTGLSINTGDCLYIAQIQGTGAPACEYEFISTYNSGTGATVLYNPLDNTYTNSGSSKAQCIVAKQYGTVAGNGFSITGQVWDSTTGVGGIYAALATGSFDVQINCDSCGFLGGQGGGKNGDGTGGVGQVQTQGKNGNGGGGTTSSNGGGGGENSGGATAGSGGFPGQAGSTVGNASLTTPAMGGGGGGGGASGGNGGASGGRGGGIIDVVADTLGTNCILKASGANGTAATGTEGRGGGGGGGSIRARASTILCALTASWFVGGGTGSTGSGDAGGTGGGGRVRIEVCTDSSTGDTTPASSKVVGGNTWCSVLGSVI